MNYELALNSEVQAIELNSQWNNEAGSITFNSVESAAAIGSSFVLSCPGLLLPVLSFLFSDYRLSVRRNRLEIHQTGAITL